VAKRSGKAAAAPSAHRCVRAIMSREKRACPKLSRVTMMSPAGETAETTEPASDSAVRKIALVCDWCLPRFGGLELQLIDLAKALRAAGHSVEIITATPGPDVIDGIPVRRLRGFRFPFFEFTFSLRQFRELRAALRDGEFDVVHVHCG